MAIHLLDLALTEKLRESWIDQGIQAGLEQERLEMIEFLFDKIERGSYFGDYRERNLLVTYAGVSLPQSDADASIDALVEVIYYRRGRQVTLKLMSIDISPSIEELEEKLYNEKYSELFVEAVSHFVDHTSAMGSATKIHAATEAAQNLIDAVHSSKTTFEQYGITVQKEGKKWLAFRRA